MFPRRKPIGGLGHWDCMRDLVVLGIWDSMCSDPLGSLCSCHIHTLHHPFYLMPHNFFQSFIIFPFLFLRVIGNGLMGPYHHFLYETESNCYIGALLGIYHSLMRAIIIQYYPNLILPEFCLCSQFFTDLLSVISIPPLDFLRSP